MPPTNIRRKALLTCHARLPLLLEEPQLLLLQLLAPPHLVGQQPRRVQVAPAATAPRPEQAVSMHSQLWLEAQL